ncbi:hypothetical protein CASFOL_038967 [Castilleja foliolosa]|uniref:CCHC-type domain-containing protein n=1 Tax=Castilleja foliolosa TaxID=1961234 RepID=A0ABD3BIE4_9LAMI
MDNSLNLSMDDHLNMENLDITCFQTSQASNNPENTENTIIAKIHTTKNQNLNAFKTSILRAWNPSKKVSTNILQTNTMAFIFEDEKDMNKILNQSWCFRDQQLILAKWPPDKALHEINLTKTLFWVQVSGLLVFYMNEENAKGIGDTLGTYVKADFNTPAHKWRKFLRFQVEMDINKPLLGAMGLSVNGRPRILMEIRYERLADFCFICGLIGHKNINCPDRKEGDNEATMSDKFGPWLKVENVHIKNPKSQQYSPNIPANTPINTRRGMQIDTNNSPVDNQNQREEDNPANRNSDENFSDEISNSGACMGDDEGHARGKAPHVPPGFVSNNVSFVQSKSQVSSSENGDSVAKAERSRFEKSRIDCSDIPPHISDTSDSLEISFDINSPLNNKMVDSINEKKTKGIMGIEDKPSNQDGPELRLILAWNDKVNITPLLLNNNFLHSQVTHNNNSVSRLLTTIYAPCNPSKKSAFWDLIDAFNISDNSSWLMVGDFNDITSQSEKKGGLPYASSSKHSLYDNLDSLGLIDLGFAGNPFTWSNQRTGSANIQQRLDRAVANCNWISLFPKAIITHLPAIASHHSPIK